MTNLVFAGFIVAFLALGLRQPFLWVLAYLYVDIVSPQRAATGIIYGLPLSLITFGLALGGWLLVDRGERVRFNVRQGLILALLVYCGISTTVADFPDAAAEKWSWVWKALVFAMFLPLTLRTRLRFEAAVVTMVLSLAAIIIDGAIKTALGGGGYGSLHLLINDNTGIYEGSIISCVAVAIIPLVLWLARHGTIFPPDRRVRLFAAGLIFACLLMPVGTQARTGLVCIAVLAVLTLRSVKNKLLYILGAPVLLMLAVPFLPKSYTNRMNTIEHHDSDESASTRVAVWMWTLGYVTDHPLGGGFEVYRANKLKVETRRVDSDQQGSVSSVALQQTEDHARAFHSAYFEMLGEQGWPGLVLWLLLQGLGILQLETTMRRLRRDPTPENDSDRALANALQQAHFVYMTGALFVGIAFQPFIYMLIGLQIGLVEHARRRLRPGRPAPLPGRVPAPA